MVNNNPSGINQFTRDNIETLEAIMEMLQDGAVSIFDVTLTQNVSNATASRLLSTLERAGIVESYLTKRTKNGKATAGVSKLWKLTAAYQKDLAAFEPRQLVRA